MANISITAVCQKCGSASEINYYQNINVQDSPELKSQVKDGSLFLWTCSKCGSVNLIPFPVLYHDPDEKLMIWYTPESMSGAEKTLIDKQINAITEQILSDSNGEILRGYTLRRVKEVGELIEKVNIFDAGLDDVAVEMCKYITRIELSEKSKDKTAVPDNAKFKFYKIEGPDNDITLTYPKDGQIQGVQIGFNVYEDCRGIIKRNPDVLPAPGFAIVDSEWLSTKMR